MGTFTVDLGEGAEPDGALAGRLDGEADRSGGVTRGYAWVQAVQAIAAAVRHGGGPVDVTLTADDAYRTRDMLDAVLISVEPDSPQAATMRRLLAAWDAHTGWDLAEAERRTADNGLPHLARTDVRAHDSQVAGGPAAASSAGQLGGLLPLPG